MVDDKKITAGTRLVRYLDQKTLKPFIYKDKGLDHFKPIECYQGKQKINGSVKYIYVFFYNLGLFCV